MKTAAHLHGCSRRHGRQPRSRACGWRWLASHAWNSLSPPAHAWRWLASHCRKCFVASQLPAAHAQCLRTRGVSREVACLSRDTPARARHPHTPVIKPRPCELEVHMGAKRKQKAKKTSRKVARPARPATAREPRLCRGFEARLEAACVGCCSSPWARGLVRLPSSALAVLACREEQAFGCGTLPASFPRTRSTFDCSGRGRARNGQGLPSAAWVLVTDHHHSRPRDLRFPTRDCTWVGRGPRACDLRFPTYVSDGRGRNRTQGTAGQKIWQKPRCPCTCTWVSWYLYLGVLYLYLGVLYLRFVRGGFRPVFLGPRRGAGKRGKKTREGSAGRQRGWGESLSLDGGASPSTRPIRRPATPCSSLGARRR